MQQRRWVWVVVLVLAAGAAGVYLVTRPRLEAVLGTLERRAWRDQAIATINARVADPKWLESELEKLRPAIASTRPSWDGKWVGDEVLIFRNGEWMVCQNVCKKSRPVSIEDIFIGRGSDGKWYYSTFHFCSGKVVLSQEYPPDSLAHFVQGYWLVPFTPPSDECLKRTWSGGDYGEAKAPSTHPR